MNTTMTLKNSLVLLIAMSSLAACSKKNGFGTLEISAESIDAAGQALKSSQYNVNLHPMNKTVCDPWGGGGTGGLQKGLKASLFYRGIGMPRYYSAQEYVDKTVASAQSLFMSDLNVPTRMFSEGFSTQTSGVVKDDAGNKLIEYFGLKFETVLKLRADQNEGSYELGTLADDGIIVKAKVDGVWKTIINNDGDHPTQMGCAASALNLNRDSAIPLEITYYQGPRYHIANVLMMREPANIGKDQECGKLGNTYYFDPNNQSVPLAPYQGLLARGWAPISADNFYLPGQESYNPCAPGTNPVISNFAVREVLSNDVLVNWTTDIDSTTQVLVTEVSTGVQTLTSADNLLRTSHNVQVSGLQPGTTYTLQAISISADMGKTMSSAITVTTTF
jgi:hypothetical protein